MTDNGSLPKSVVDEMQSVFDDLDLMRQPPVNAFTLQEFYDKYIVECEVNNMPEERRLKLDSMRSRLVEMVKSEELVSEIFSSTGRNTVFYWKK